MKPGRDMDRLVAKEVMDNPFVEPERPYEYPPPCKHCGHWCSDDCHHSTEDDAAWAVVRAMHDKGWRLWLFPPHDDALVFTVHFAKIGGAHRFAQAQTFAEAVCVAALRALGVEP